MKTVELALALLGTGLQVSLCFVLLFRRYYRQFPIFCAYTAFSVVSSISGMAVRNTASVYFDVYWVTEVGYVLLAFLALQEAFRSVFRNFYSISGFPLLFPGIGILMIGIAALRTLLRSKLPGSMLAATLISSEIAVGFLQFGIFCLFIILVRFFHMRWRQHAFGVVLGLGLASAGSLVVFLLRSEFGTKFDPIVRITPPIAYIMAVLVWLWTFLRPEPPHPLQGWAPALTPEQMVSELRRYTKAVKDMLRR